VTEIIIKKSLTINSC